MTELSIDNAVDFVEFTLDMLRDKTGSATFYITAARKELDPLQTKSLGPEKIWLIKADVDIQKSNGIITTSSIIVHHNELPEAEYVLLFVAKKLIETLVWIAKKEVKEHT